MHSWEGVALKKKRHASLAQKVGQRFRWRTLYRYCYYISNFLEICFYENIVQNMGAAVTQAA